MKKKFSIITCTKNSDSTLEQSILSLDNQTYTDYEHIFIDAYSADKTLSICHNAKNSKVVQKKLSLYQSLNYGIQLAKGDIVFFLHSDDYLYKNNILKKISDIFNKNPTLDLVYGNILIKNKNSKKIVRNWKSGIMSKFFINNFVMPPHTSIFYKKSLFDKVGLFDEQYKVASDFEHMNRIFRNKKINFFYFDEYILMMDSGGLSGKSFLNVVLQNIDNIKIMLKYGGKTTLLPYYLLIKFCVKLKQFF
jgi:glycosyltransferase involved in cell wall biosynthesis